ncbi:MAG: hypothetical protein ACKVZJ_08185 [Phycisphaerales bacterium]
MIGAPLNPTAIRVTALADDGTGAASLRRATQSGSSAFSLLEAASKPRGEGDDDAKRTTPEMTQEQARSAAAELVSISLVQPVLAQLRKTNQAWGPFKPGAHEKQFGPLIDAQVAMRITNSTNFPIVDAVARNLFEVSQRLNGKQSDDDRLPKPGEFRALPSESEPAEFLSLRADSSAEFQRGGVNDAAVPAISLQVAPAVAPSAAVPAAVQTPRRAERTP